MAALPSPSDPSVPLSIEPVVGWRLWAVGLDTAGPVLISPLRDQPWGRREETKCVCSRGRMHRVPSDGCSCGLYAARRLKDLRLVAGPTTSLPVAVVGSVSMWGRVVEHAMGYRAELAYPDRIRLVCGACFAMGHVGQPSRVEDPGDGKLYPVCRAHAALGRSDRSAIEPSELERQLLAAYAVEPLPAHVLREAGFRKVSPSRWTNARPAPGARQPGRSRRRRTSWAALLAAYVVVRALGLYPESAPPSAPSVVVDLGPSPGPLEIQLEPPTPPAFPPAPTGRMRKVPDFAIVCGHRVGNTVELMGCARKEAELFGAASRPPESRKECDLGNAYSRKGRFSVCWFSLAEDMPDPGTGLVFLYLPGVHWWDLHGS